MLIANGQELDNSLPRSILKRERDRDRDGRELNLITQIHLDACKTCMLFNIIKKEIFGSNLRVQASC
jgi:hypothetical protein